MLSGRLGNNMWPLAHRGLGKGPGSEGNAGRRYDERFHRAELRGMCGLPLTLLEIAPQDFDLWQSINLLNAKWAMAEMFRIIE